MTSKNGALFGRFNLFSFTTDQSEKYIILTILIYLFFKANKTIENIFSGTAASAHHTTCLTLTNYGIAAKDKILKLFNDYSLTLHEISPTWPRHIHNRPDFSKREPAGCLMVQYFLNTDTAFVLVPSLKEMESHSIVDRDMGPSGGASYLCYCLFRGEQQILRVHKGHISWLSQNFQGFYKTPWLLQVSNDRGNLAVGLTKTQLCSP